MDYFTRYKTYLFILIALIVVLAVSSFYLYFFSSGFEIDAKLSLEGSPKIDVLLNNDSSHVVNNIAIFVNSEVFQYIGTFPANSSLSIAIPVSAEKTLLKITVNNSPDYEQEFTLNKASQNENTISYSFKYAFGKNTDINLNVCSTVEEEQKFKVDLSHDGALIDGENTTDLLLLSKECKTLQYSLAYTETGNKKVKFKIYNDVYLKELTISGVVQ